MRRSMRARGFSIGGSNEKRTGIPSDLRRNARYRRASKAVAVRRQTCEDHRTHLWPRRFQCHFAGTDRRGQGVMRRIDGSLCNPTGGETVKDLMIALENHPGALAGMGDALGRSGVSIEGGGAWVVNGLGVAHFLFNDGAAARIALEVAGIQVLAERDVLIQRLNQAQPGQLGKIMRRMAEACVNIEVLYS